MSISNEIVVFLAYAIGIFTIFFFGKVLLLPVKLLGRLVINSIIGAGILAAVNIAGSAFSLAVPLNVLNALIVGILGMPGAILLLLFLN